MGIISRIFGGNASKQQTAPALHTAQDDFNLAAPDGRRKMQSLMAGIRQTTQALTRKDMRDWRRAWQMAISTERPDRRALYNIYTDVAVDLHLSGCVEQRKGLVLSRSFRLTNAGGEVADEAALYFRQAWFRQLMSLCLDSRYWGHSLIELGALTTDGDGCPCYEGVTLIPRQHVIPELHRVTTDPGQDPAKGIDYRERPWTDRLIEAGAPEELGLYLKAATQTIPKKNTLAFWDTFAEVFGMPMRIARTSSRDEKELQRTESMLAGMGANFWSIFPEGTDIQIVESSRGDAYNVYDRRIDRANSELSKLILGQTMTVEDGSSLSQSQTHLKVLENLVEDDAAMLRDIVNSQLLPRMVRHGFPLAGMVFDWDYSVDYTPEQKLAYEQFAGSMYRLSPEYFEREYSIPADMLTPKAEQAAEGGEPEGTDPDEGGITGEKGKDGNDFFD